MSFKQDIALQRMVLVAGVLLMFVKGFAFIQTGSNAILSDALESLVNISSGAFALYSLWYASRPSDVNHPYGHGKIEFISGLLEGVLILIAGIAIVSKAVYNLIYPQVVAQLMLGVLLTFITGLVNFLLGLRLKKTGEDKKSMVLISEGTHLMSDGYTSFALVLGVALVWLTKKVWIDNLLAIGFGLYILYAAYRILRQSIAGIMDEVDQSLVESIVKVLEKQRKPDWIDVHNLRAVKYGRDIHIDCHVTLPWYRSLEESHNDLDEIEGIVRKEFRAQVEFFIHADPCVESSCSICALKTCKERKHPFIKKVEWNVSNALAEAKHTLNS